MRNSRGRSRVFVTNLSSDATPEEIRVLFGGSAQTPVNIASDRIGSAVLEFTRPGVAAAAIRTFDGLEFAGRRLRLTTSRRPKRVSAART
jgi:RNA recognition motif-containing protein